MGRNTEGIKDLILEILKEKGNEGSNTITMNVLQK